MPKQAIRALAPAASINATTNSPGVDVSDFTGNGTLMLDSAALTGTTPTMNVTIEHADAIGGPWAASGVSFAQVTNAAASNQQLAVSLDRFKPFIRAVSTLGGTSPVAVRGVYLIGNLAL